MFVEDPSRKILDKINLPLIPTNISYGRTTGLSGFFYYDTPTPAAANGTGFIGFAQTPELTTAPGLYYNTVATTITIPENCLVYLHHRMGPTPHPEFHALSGRNARIQPHHRVFALGPTPPTVLNPATP